MPKATIVVEIKILSKLRKPANAKRPEYYLSWGVSNAQLENLIQGRGTCPCSPRHKIVLEVVGPVGEGTGSVVG
jgi:hypothetical protein